MSLPATPHDALFRALVSSPARAGALLMEYLPEPVAALLDPETPPEAVEGSFVDADAARTQCDALFRVRLRTGHDARIYVLLEHKSGVDAATPLQILKYMVGIWQREIESGTARDRLPPIVPLVFFHGRGRWTAARSVMEMIDARHSSPITIFGAVSFVRPGDACAAYRPLALELAAACPAAPGVRPTLPGRAPALALAALRGSQTTGLRTA